MTTTNGTSAQASSMHRLASLYVGDCLPDVLDLLDQLHTAASEGSLVLGLVNNAGLLIKRSFGEWAVQDMARLFQVNMITPTMLVQGLRDRFAGGGEAHVVNISSMGGFQGSVKFPGLAAYSASKAALANLSECLAEEWKDRGIRCNCLALGSVDTEMLKAAFPGYRSPTSSGEIGAFIARFVLEGHRHFNRKILPVATATP